MTFPKLSAIFQNSITFFRPGKWRLQIPWLFQVFRDNGVAIFTLAFPLFLIHFSFSAETLPADSHLIHTKSANVHGTSAESFQEQRNLKKELQPSWWQRDVKFHTSRIHGDTGTKSGFG